MLTKAGIEYNKMLAEEHPEEAKMLGIRQAPTLIVNNEKLAGLGSIRQYINGREI
jgi:protein-disulfide isomerase